MPHRLGSVERERGIALIGLRGLQGWAFSLNLSSARYPSSDSKVALDAISHRRRGNGIQA